MLNDGGENNLRRFKLMIMLINNKHCINDTFSKCSYLIKKMECRLL